MVRFGILGAGNIAHRFAKSLEHVEGAKLVALSARKAQKAQAFAHEFGVDGSKAYTSHEQLLDDAGVDAIYLALPHALHREWAIAALRAGKAVLCEKPACLTAAEMEEVASVAHSTNTLFMEAMKPRFVPLRASIEEALGQIGEIRHVEATLCNDMMSFVDGAQTYHMGGGPGAGVLLDCGIYCASWIDELCPGTFKTTSVVCEKHKDVDVYVDAQLSFGDITARLECAFDRAKPRTCTIEGERGRIVVEDLHRPTRATLLLTGEPMQVMESPYEVDDFYAQIVHFVKLVADKKTESPVMNLNDSIRCAQILDACRS
ncbi:MAG: Gfo/Idh/MocA family oxidoreductase [Atopobiaceae bacterium]|nr:Gfo/Idh/MocA family oxidoreductase [Atopobiaceae bacterium]